MFPDAWRHLQCCPVPPAARPQPVIPLQLPSELPPLPVCFRLSPSICPLLSRQVVLPEIHKTFSMPAATAEAREKLAEVQGQLCGVLQVIVQKLSEHDDTKAAVLQYADSVREREGGRRG